MNRDKGAWAWVILCAALLAGGVARAQPPVPEGGVLRVDEQRVQRWNQFVDGLLALHRSRLKDRRLRQSEQTGGYSGREDFYRQVSYFDREQQRLLSRLQWETENPRNLHLIELFEYDSAGRVAIDYLAAYLPEHRNAPIQTLVNLHHYNGELHAFRQFDASGERIYEQCKGSFRGKAVFLSLEENQLSTPEGLDGAVTDRPLYRACFAGLEKNIEPVLERIYRLAETPALRSEPSAQDRRRSRARQRLEQLDRRLFAEPQNPRLYVLRGDAHRQLHRHPEAIADYSRALALDDNLDEAYLGRGLVYGREGKLEAAVDDLSVYIERHPDSSYAHTKRAVRYIWMGRLERAEADLNRAIELNYRNAEAHDDLGVIHGQRGDLGKALHHFDTALRLDPGYQKAYHNKALVLYTRRDHDKALVNINNALVLDPDNRNSLLLKATILEALGETEQAQQIADHAERMPEGDWTEHFALD